MATIAALLERTINPSVHQLFQLRLFSQTSELLPLATEVQILKEYETYTSIYPICVASALSAIPSEAARLPLVKNLWEEHGEGNPLRGHRYLMHCWVQSVSAMLDIQQTTQRPLVHSTPEACNLLMSASEESGLFRFGLILGLESTNIKQLEGLLTHLPASSRPEADRRYVDLHLEADEGHVEELLEAVPYLVKTDADLEQVLKGAHQSVQADIVFWTGIDALAMGSPARP